MSSSYESSYAEQYSSAPDGVLPVFAATDFVPYKIPVTTLDEIIKAAGDLSVGENQRLVVSLRDTDGELPPSRLSSPTKSLPWWPKTS
jgi:hypothetical protein